MAEPDASHGDAKEEFPWDGILHPGDSFEERQGEICCYWPRRETERVLAAASNVPEWKFVDTAAEDISPDTHAVPPEPVTGDVSFNSETSHFNAKATIHFLKPNQQQFFMYKITLRSVNKRELQGKVQAALTARTWDCQRRIVDAVIDVGALVTIRSRDRLATVTLSSDSAPPYLIVEAREGNPESDGKATEVDASYLPFDGSSHFTGLYSSLGIEDVCNDKILTFGYNRKETTATHSDRNTFKETIRLIPTPGTVLGHKKTISAGFKKLKNINHGLFDFVLRFPNRILGRSSQSVTSPPLSGQSNGVVTAGSPQLQAGQPPVAAPAAQPPVAAAAAPPSVAAAAAPPSVAAPASPPSGSVSVAKQV